MALLFDIKNQVGILIPSGSLDAAAVDSVRREVTSWWEAHPELRYIVVDLAAVGFMDSSGLGALIGMLKRAAARGGDVRLARPRRNVKVVLDITRANQIFTVCDTIEDAIASVSTIA